MRIKKLFAGVLAGAMALSCMVTGVSAADTKMPTFNGFNTSWGSTWSGVSVWDSDTVEATIEDIMDAAGVDDIDEFGGFLFQIWNVKGGYTAGYEVYVNDELYASGVTTVTDDDSTLVTILTATMGGETAFETTDVIKGVITDYDDTLIYEISEEDLSAKSYVITLENEDGEEAEIEGNTYFVDGDSYYVGVDLSDIPAGYPVTITGVEFVY